MKKLAIGILAHVDAGKTTLAEAMLYQAGNLRKLGRVDHGTTVMDTHPLERERGITIFTGQAVMRFDDCQITLLDTPGHVDFSGETERTLQVLDAAILVISGTDGIQAHTLTLWRLLRNYHIPTFLFITKMDYARKSHDELMAELHEELGSACINFSQEDCGDRNEQMALCDEEVLEAFLETEEISDEAIAKMVMEEKVFPCYFGSGLKMEGIDAFLDALKTYNPMPKYPTDFGARVFKISRDEKGTRLTHLKITGGALKVKSVLDAQKPKEKIDQIRILEGKKFQIIDLVESGDICAVTGLSDSFSGEGLGFEALSTAPILEPVMAYRVILPDGMDPETAMGKLKELEEEDPLLKCAWLPQQEIQIKLMGRIQIEVLATLVEERFGMKIGFDQGSVLYRETITNIVEGVGHYEPLRHYAEAHFKLSPLPAGSGVIINSSCSEDELDRNWQRLILTHLGEKNHLGVLTGSPITDIKVTLIGGKAHLKHTEGGDFRQATYRGVRQGLMQAESVLLEPYNAFKLILPAEFLGKAMTDLRVRFGELNDPEDNHGMMQLSGKIPVVTINDYAEVLASYTGGRGRLFLSPAGYGPCHNSEEVIQQMGYDPERDLENSPDSVFCSHGAGFIVKWDKVQEMMHIRSCLKPEKEEISYQYKKKHVSDDEMAAIMNKIAGPPKETQVLYKKTFESVSFDSKVEFQPFSNYYIVDGYNVIFGWEGLKKKAEEDLSSARDYLCHVLSDFAAFEQSRISVIFDGYRIAGNIGEKEMIGGVEIVFTKELETADAFIERRIYEIGKNERVIIVTSDALIQQTAVHKGVLRMSAKEFEAVVATSYEKTKKIISELNRPIYAGSISEMKH